MRDLFFRIADRDAPRTEAEVQADIRQLLLSAPLQLNENDLEIVSLESQVGDRRRIDIETGSAVIEVKRDLRSGKIKKDAISQLASYVEARTNQTGRRFVGILTDGAEWLCYDLQGGALHEVATLTVRRSHEDLDHLLVWIEGVLATARNITPNALEITRRLGAGSSSHQLDSSTIKTLYSINKNEPSVQMKRRLWTKLLTSSLGTQFEDSDDLFVEHTLLVNSAEIIAHCMLGISPEEAGPQALLSGELFERSGIYGVVEEDFFDWVVEIEGGQEFVRALARRLARFDWANVEQDVLKVLYESVIGTETRKRLGEYYTPDWLAELIVNETVVDPLNEKVLDPACGSGTFLFRAVKKYIQTAREKGVDAASILDGVTRNVVGMDLHPVAVTFARVTYLLALGRDLLMGKRNQIFVPVYLGDSIQWNDQATTLWNANNLVIPVDDKAELFASELRFPDKVLENAAVFDDLVEAMADLASGRKPTDRIPSLKPLFQRLAIPENARSTIEATFKTMCSLHDEGRDHIWSYYVRNLARPMWMSRPKNRADVLLGNPPWLAFRHMPDEMQETFRTLSEQRGLWHGAENATHQDLSALFVVRATELYLNENGRFGMVMPNAVVDRDHYAGFREGYYSSTSQDVSIAFKPSWDLRRIRPHFFPRGSSVVFGRRSQMPSPMPTAATIFSGKLPRGSSALKEVEPNLIRDEGAVTVISEHASPYRTRFRQGAIFSPRVCFFVERQPVGPLGAVAGRVPVISSRSSNEKKPWKSMPSIEGVVEETFLRPLYSGENLLPYRTTASLLAIVPQNARRLLKNSEEIASFPGLADWWRKAETIWEKNKSKSTKLSLFEQLDYMSKLSAQFPTPRLRVIYNSSGMHLAAAKLNDSNGVINNKLYWCAVHDQEEADYLCAVLNSPVTTEMVRPLMSYGKDERDVHKHVWKLNIPEYDKKRPTLARLAHLGATAAEIAAKVEVDPELHFSASRRRVRAALADEGVSEEIDNIVFELLS